MKRLWAPWRIRFILEHPKMTGCIFCDLPKNAHDEANLIVARGKYAFVIMNKYPYNSGHLMVVPYTHTSEITALSDAELLEVHRWIRDSVKILGAEMRAQGFNVGMNLGEAGGAGIRDHMHYHIVPRWNGDTNYMPVLGETKILPESLEETFARLRTPFSQLSKN